MLFQIGDKIVLGKCANEIYYFEEEGWIEYSDYQQSYYYQRFIINREMIRKNGISFPNYLRYQDPPFFVKAMLLAERFYALKDSVYVYRNDGAHVKWNDRKVNDLLKGSLDVIQLCLENRLGILYATIIRKFVSSRYMLDILEDSLVTGNDCVLEFYHKMVETLDLELLGDQAEKLDLAYAQKLAEAKLKRNVCYRHRVIWNDEEILCPDNEKPKVSVIIPVYNTRDYLGICMDSIVGQTLESIQVICIDDGSDDGSSEILRKYERKYENVTVYRQENAGLSAARNAGLRLAKGKYVYFMDSDDVLTRTALEELWECAEHDDLDIIYFSAKSFYDSPSVEKEYRTTYFDSAYKRKGDYPRILTGEDMLVEQNKCQDYYTSVCIQFYKTEFLSRNQLDFYEGLLHEDNLFSLMAIVAAKRTRCISNVYFYRRIRGNSIMSTNLSYRNLLGYYLSAIDGVRVLAGLECQAEAKKIIAQKLYTLNQNQVGYKWLRLHPADKVLFKASLTPTDRLLFDSFCMPMITLREQIQKSPKDVQEANQRMQRAKDEISKLKKEISNLKKTTVSKESRSYKIGRFITYVPRKLRGGIRCLKQHGVSYTVQRIRTKIVHRFCKKK